MEYLAIPLIVSIVLLLVLAFYVSKLSFIKITLTYRESINKELIKELEDYKSRYKSCLRDRYNLEQEHKKEIDTIFRNQNKYKG